MVDEPVPGATPEPERHSLESLGHGSLIAFVGQLLNLAILFGIRVTLVQFLTVQEFGILVLGVSLFAILQAILCLGIPTAVARQVAHSRDAKERQVVRRLGFWLTLAPCIIVPAVLVPTAALWSGVIGISGFETVIAFLSVNLAFVMMATLLSAYFQGIEDVVPYTIFLLVINPLLTLVFLGALFGLGLGLTGAVLAYLLASMVTLLGLVGYAFWRRARLLAPPPVPPGLTVTHASSTTARSLLLFSLPLALVGLASAAPGNADTLIVGALNPVEVAGSYNAGLALGRLVGVGVTSVAFIMLPVASRLHARGDFVELRRSYATITKWLLLVALPFFFLFAFFPVASLTFLYGSKVSTPAYASTPEVLIIVSVGAIVASLLGPAVAVLTGMGRLRALVRATVVSASVDVVGSFVLVPSLGAVGAAIAFAAATALLPAICLLEINRLATVNAFTGTLAKPVLAVTLLFGPIFGVLAFLHWTPTVLEVPLIFLVVAAGYFLAIPATRSLDTEDGHLLAVVEGFLGRPLPRVRRFGARFVHRSSPPGAVPPP